MTGFLDRMVEASLKENAGDAVSLLQLDSSTGWSRPH